MKHKFEEYFGVDIPTAQRILIELVSSFDERHPQEEVCRV